MGTIKNLFKRFLNWIAEPYRARKKQREWQERQDMLRLRHCGRIDEESGDIIPWEEECDAHE